VQQIVVGIGRERRNILSRGGLIVYVKDPDPEFKPQVMSEERGRGTQVVQGIS